MSGDGQAGLVERTLAEDLVVAVLSPGGQPVSDVGVGFRVIMGDGSVAAWQILTDARGEARARYTLGISPGGEWIEAFVPGEPLVQPVMFVADARLPLLETVSGDGQNMREGSALIEPLVVRARHPVTGAPLEGVQVRFQVTAGGPADVIPEFVFTDSTGVAMAAASGDMTAQRAFIDVTLPEYPGVPPERISAAFSPVVCDETHPLLARSPLVDTRAPGEEVDLAVEVWGYDRQAAQCVPAPDTRVMFQRVFGDGSTAPDIVQADANGIATYPYEFGPDHEPDIVWANAELSEVSLALAIPWVKVTAITFDHAPGDRNDGADTRWDGAADVQAPEYEVASGRRDPAAYVAGRTPITIRTRVEAHPYATRAVIRAVGIAQAHPTPVALGDVRDEVVRLPGDLVLTIQDPVHIAVAKDRFLWQWRISDINLEGGSEFSISRTGPHTAYVVLSTPQAPFAEPWADALDYATSWAESAATAEVAASRITHGIFWGTGLTYETRAGAPCFGGWGVFDLTRFIAALRTSREYAGACYDPSRALVTLANGLGASMRWRLIDRIDGPLNLIDPIGRRTLVTNNPFRHPQEPPIHHDERTGGFGNHAVAVIGDRVWDPTLRYEDVPDRTPEFNTAGWQREFRMPHGALLLPSGVAYRNYLDRLIDDLSARQGVPHAPAAPNVSHPRFVVRQ